MNELSSTTGQVPRPDYAVELASLDIPRRCEPVESPTFIVRPHSVAGTSTVGGGGSMVGRNGSGGGGSASATQSPAYEFHHSYDGAAINGRYSPSAYSLGTLPGFNSPTSRMSVAYDFSLPVPERKYTGIMALAVIPSKNSITEMISPRCSSFE